MMLKDNKKLVLLLFQFLLFVNGLKWRTINSNESWTEMHSYPFEGNKQALPFPFQSQLLPIHLLSGEGDNSIASCKFTNQSIDVKHIITKINFFQ